MHSFALGLAHARARVGMLLAVVLTASALTGSETAAEPPSSGAVGALARLKAGNARFAADPTVALPIDLARRQRLVGGQDPMAVVLSCADSRVPPEVIFNTGLGDLFVVRSAGEVLDRSVLASLEYGAEHLKTPLLVVMGHEFCGAVKAATDADRRSMGPNLDFLISAIQPAVARTERTLFNDPLVAAVLANVEQIVDDLQSRSEILKRRVEAGELHIVGAYYELTTGRVTFSQPVPTERPAATPARTTRAPARPTIEIQELQPDRAREEGRLASKKAPAEKKAVPEPASPGAAAPAPADAGKPKPH